MTSRLLTVEEVLALLPENVRRIVELTAGVSAADRASPEPGEWSVVEVLAHQRACADMWDGYIVRMVAEDHPTMRAVNPRTWIKKTDYVDLDFESSFQAFAAQRADLLAVLQPLTPDEWSRGATMTGAGRPLEQTVHDYASHLARHERTHVKQIAAVVRQVAGN